MSDQVLICQNCQNPFVYSQIEQAQDAQEEKPTPLYCPICQSIKNSATKHPSKPKKSVI